MINLTKLTIATCYYSANNMIAKQINYKNILQLKYTRIFITVCFTIITAETLSSPFFHCQIMVFLFIRNIRKFIYSSICYETLFHFISPSNLYYCPITARYKNLNIFLFWLPHYLCFVLKTPLQTFLTVSNF